MVLSVVCVPLICILHAITMFTWLSSSQSITQSVRLLPNNSNSHTGSVRLSKHIQEVAIIDNKWSVLLQQQNTWQFILTLDNTWAFDPILISSVKLVISSPSIADGFSANPKNPSATFDDLVFGFTTDNIEYFSMWIPFDNVGQKSRIYPSCSTDNVAPQSFVVGDIASLPNTKRGCDVAGGDCLNWNTIFPKNAQHPQVMETNHFPITFILENDPIANLLYIYFHSATFSSTFIQKCRFVSLPTHRGLKIYIGGNDPGQTFIISSFQIESWTAEPTTMNPTNIPTNVPSLTPTNMPFAAPTNIPTNRPSNNPTDRPTNVPSFTPTNIPFATPTNIPTISPTLLPTDVPSITPTNDPSITPSIYPTAAPSHAPTLPPSAAPTSPPSVAPTVPPSSAPTAIPSNAPSLPPSNAPSSAPTAPPSNAPTESPSSAPSFVPTLPPSRAPSFAPTPKPSLNPTKTPTSLPSLTPTYAPSDLPSTQPTKRPTEDPTQIPSSKPTLSPITSAQPTNTPSINPTFGPVPIPTQHPITNIPTEHPSTYSPTIEPTANPTIEPTLNPTMNPSVAPTTLEPTVNPSMYPTTDPSKPTFHPTKRPTLNPAIQTVTTPTLRPLYTFYPTTEAPTAIPTADPVAGLSSTESEATDAIESTTNTLHTTEIVEIIKANSNNKGGINAENILGSAKFGEIILPLTLIVLVGGCALCCVIIVIIRQLCMRFGGNKKPHKYINPVTNHKDERDGAARSPLSMSDSIDAQHIHHVHHIHPRRPHLMPCDDGKFLTVPLKKNTFCRNLSDHGRDDDMMMDDIVDEMDDSYQRKSKYHRTLARDSDSHQTPLASSSDSDDTMMVRPDRHNYSTLTLKSGKAIVEELRDDVEIAEAHQSPKFKFRKRPYHHITSSGFDRLQSAINEAKTHSDFDKLEDLIKKGKIPSPNWHGKGSMYRTYTFGTNKDTIDEDEEYFPNERSNKQPSESTVPSSESTESSVEPVMMKKTKVENKKVPLDENELANKLSSVLKNDRKSKKRRNVMNIMMESEQYVD